jgi:hypothetical protein
LTGKEFDLGARLLLAGLDDQQPAERYETMLRQLDKIASVIPPDPKARGRGRPRVNDDLFAVTELLVDDWENATRKRFAADWQNGEPFNDATRFVAETVE